MEVKKEKQYVSCMKFNGIPILPPLMTDDIREEMNYYKRLALAVDQRLKSLQLADETNQDQSSIEEDFDITPENLVHDSVEHSQNSVTDNAQSDTVCEATVITNQIGKTDKSKKQLTKQKNSKSSSDEESHHCRFNNSHSSDAVTASTDLNKYFNESTSTTKTTTGETTPEIRRPKVPNTLDIVPISLDSNRISSDMSTPKFVRQGSYVLDTPSPVLLAHIQPGVDVPSTLRKRRKSLETMKNSTTFILESSKEKFKPRRNSASSAIHKIQKNLQKSAKSVDCIRSMFCKEFGSKKKFTSKISRTNGLLKNEKLEQVSILSLADKMEQDLGSLRNAQKKEENVNFVSPEKILHLFQGIQLMQKTQMEELMKKQQREQEKLQADFKRQQMVLLMQIKKVFPDSMVHLEDEVIEDRRDFMANGDGMDKNVKDGRKMEIVGEKTREDFSRQLFPQNGRVMSRKHYTEKHCQAVTVINAFVRGYLVRRLMKTERVIALKNTYKEALHCMLNLHVDAPLSLSEINFLHRLQLQCDAASLNIVTLFTQNPAERMEIIAHDRYVKQSRSERPNSARSYSFATQRTLARKKLKESGDCQTPLSTNRSCVLVRARCQTWTSNTKEKRPACSSINKGIKRSTSAGTMRKPWR